MGKKLVFTACTSKMTTTFKAYNLAVFGSKLNETCTGWSIASQGFQKWPKIGVYRMYQQNEHHFEGVYLGHFQSKKLVLGGFSDFKNEHKFALTKALNSTVCV